MSVNQIDLETTLFQNVIQRDPRWLVDGANNNDTGSQRTILIYPSADSIEEFKIERNSYGPEFGLAAGGQISIITKSGSNDFHGGVFYSVVMTH